MKDLNKTVAKFTFKGKQYEVDQLLDSKWGSRASTPHYMFDVFLVDRGSVQHICQFESYEGADYIKLAKEELRTGKENLL